MLLYEIFAKDGMPQLLYACPVALVFVYLTVFAYCRAGNLGSVQIFVYFI